MKKSTKKILITASVVLASLILIAGTVMALFYFGILHLNDPSKAEYPVRGVDVSSYQGDIDWETLASQEISFAFIKATEGSSYQDPCFEYNWMQASSTDLRIGAYHFFSFESPGATQAENFIKAVSPVENMLPPVIDVEFYGKFSPSDIDADSISKELRTMVDKLTEHYGMKPVLYVTLSSNNNIIRSDFHDCDLWYRSVYSKVENGIDWTFWQFSNRHRLKGYEGKETYIDMNVFCGSIEEFENYPVK